MSIQHFLWTQELGYLTHPNIPLETKNLRIADIGTGTGIWLLELAKALPLPSSVQLDGFDVDLSLTPPNSWLPANVNMHKWDVYDDLPDEYLGRFDLVHVRFFLCVVRDSDPGVLLKRLLLMLKPGGYIQWTEQDLLTCTIASAASENNVQQTEELQKFALSPTPYWPSTATRWVAGLARIFEEEGLQRVLEDRRKSQPSLLPYWQDVTLLAMEEISNKLPNGAEVGVMIQKAVQEYEESDRGVAIISDRVTIIGMRT
ncbi:hypothetical protein MMC28_004729 [Mycoblastus sanguinarius]|nr:hypothetical protein [Mycoblastus sanguinarius]